MSGDASARNVVEFPPLLAGFSAVTYISAIGENVVEDPGVVGATGAAVAVGKGCPTDGGVLVAAAVCEGAGVPGTVAALLGTDVAVGGVVGTAVTGGAPGLAGT